MLGEIARIGKQQPHELTGTDLVHIDLTMGNVLFDDSGTVTDVVDWNLGAYLGDRLFALVKTRFDREWFVRSPEADPVEDAATAHLDGLLAERIAPATLRMYWRSRSASDNPRALTPGCTRTDDFGAFPDLCRPATVESLLRSVCHDD